MTTGADPEVVAELEREGLFPPLDPEPEVPEPEPAPGGEEDLPTRRVS